MPDTNQDIQVSEAARIIGLSEDSTRRLGDSGVLTIRRTASGLRLYDRAECEAYARKRAAQRGEEGDNSPDRLRSLLLETHIETIAQLTAERDEQLERADALSETLHVSVEELRKSNRDLANCRAALARSRRDKKS